jgi:hypothetical protein
MRARETRGIVMGTTTRSVVATACFMAAIFASLPAWSETPAMDQRGVPADWFVYGVVIVLFLAALVALLMVRAAVYGTKWSLSDALSEETNVTAMTTGAAGGQVPMLDKDGKPITVVEMRASVSRLIALMGMLVILLMFLGFGSFALFRFATTGKMPDDIDRIVDFLVAGMTLFAPYVVNKFSSLFEGLAPKR